MTNSATAVSLAGPLYRTLPESTVSYGKDAVELAATAGLILDPWQAQVVIDTLAERADSQWAAREVGLIVPRQNGKGSILEAIELAALFLLDEKLIIHSAHEFKTAAEAYLRIRNLVQGTPDLDRLVARNGYHNAHGSEGIELKSGQRLRFVARTGGSGRGFTGDRIILDEAYNLSKASMSALAFTMSAVENPQIWYTSSAPLPDEKSGVLRELCKRGREGSPGLAFFEWCAPEGADLMDPQAWAIANPGYPHRIGAETIQTERRMITDDADFARERLGHWIDPLTDIPQVIPPELWAAGSSMSELEGQPCFALEVAEDRSWAAFASAGKSSLGGFLHGEVIDYREGTPWTIARAVELKAKWGGKFAIAKSSPAASLIEDLKRAGLTDDDIVLISTEDHAKACGQLYDSVVNGAFKHRDQAHLNVSVRGAVKRDFGDAWVWSRRKSTVDISPLVAVTLAGYLHSIATTTMALPSVVHL